MIYKAPKSQKESGLIDNVCKAIPILKVTQSHQLIQCRDVYTVCHSLVYSNNFFKTLFCVRDD